MQFIHENSSEQRQETRASMTMTEYTLCDYI